MDVSKGFQIELPSVFIPWSISEADLLARIAVANPKKITAGYYTIKCVSLSGLRHMLGFHFLPRVGGRLVEFEFFRDNYPDYPDLSESFSEFQVHLETTFGPPTEGFGTQNCAWSFGVFVLNHFIQERFGPEEHVRLKKLHASN